MNDTFENLPLNPSKTPLFVPSSESDRQAYMREQILIHAWLSQKKEGTTRRNYERIIKQFFLKFPGTSLKSVNIGHLAVYLNSLSHLSNSSKRVAKDCLSSLLNFCVRDGYLDRNPAINLDRIVVPNRLSSRLLSEEDTLRLLSSSTSLRDQLILKCLYVTGLRVSEVAGLTWKSFFVRKDGVQITVVGKGYKTRVILISLSFYEELLQLRLEEDGSSVFKSTHEPYGGLTTRQIRNVVRNAAKKAGLGEVSPHWLRHCHATHSLDNGAPIHKIQKNLGHSSIATTGRYLDASPVDLSSKYLKLGND